MINAKVAQLRQHENVYEMNVNISSGHGVLASRCCKCRGPLDFTRVYIKSIARTILQCRICKHEIGLD
jgi:hypothetical protein